MTLLQRGGCTRASVTPYAHTLTQIHSQRHTHTHIRRHRAKGEQYTQHAQIRLPVHFWIRTQIIMLLISMSANYCGGPYQIYTNNIALGLTRMTLALQSLYVYLTLSTSQILSSQSYSSAITQRSRRSRQRNSEAPLRHALYCLQKAVAPTVRVGQ